METLDCSIENQCKVEGTIIANPCSNQVTGPLLQKLVVYSTSFGRRVTYEALCDLRLKHWFAIDSSFYHQIPMKNFEIFITKPGKLFIVLYCFLLRY